MLQVSLHTYVLTHLKKLKILTFFKNYIKQIVFLIYFFFNIKFKMNIM